MANKPPRTFFHLKKVKSTQDVALEKALLIPVDDSSDDESLNWILVLADQQIHGRGTRSREWFSSDQSQNQLILSLASRISRGIQSKPLHQLTLLMGEAVVTALIKLGAKSENLFLKWPNDLMLMTPTRSWKKVGGILAEHKKNCLVIGVGLNLFSTPADVLTAASLKDVLPASTERDPNFREILCHEILSEFHQALKLWLSDPAYYMAQLGIRLNQSLMKPLIGSRVKVRNSGQTASIVGIGHEGRLRIQYEDAGSEIVSVQSSEELSFFQFLPL